MPSYNNLPNFLVEPTQSRFKPISSCFSRSIFSIMASDLSILPMYVPVNSTIRKAEYALNSWVYTVKSVSSIFSNRRSANIYVYLTSLSAYWIISGDIPCLISRSIFQFSTWRIFDAASFRPKLSLHPIACSITIVSP